MRHWLVKTEPDNYSWEDLVRDKQTAWTGIRNYAARNHLRSMQTGDLVLWYYSMTQSPAIVGIAQVIKPAYQDPTTTESAWLCVNLKPVKLLPAPVPLEVIKRTASLKNMALVRISRLSVQPVTAKEYQTILQLWVKL